MKIIIRIMRLQVSAGFLSQIILRTFVLETSDLLMISLIKNLKSYLF